MSVARKQIQDMIRRRAKKFEEFRTNSSRKLTPQQVCFKFFKTFDEIKESSLDDFDFNTKLEQATKLLDSRLQSFDRGVVIELVWHNIEETTGWNNLRLNGVQIDWSTNYQLAHPGEDGSMYVDISHYFLEGCED